MNPSSQISVFGYMRIVNRQTLNVELLTLDDGTQKIAWDIKQLQSLLGISDLLHQEDLSSSVNTGVNSSGIPTIETVIAILDELGLKDLYEVRYRKQYTTIIPKTDSKRPKVAMYVVQQQSDLALSIHEKLWTGSIAELWWCVDAGSTETLLRSDRSKRLYIPSSMVTNNGTRIFTGTDTEVRLCETMGEKIAQLSYFEVFFEDFLKKGYPCNLPYTKDLDFWEKNQEILRDKKSKFIDLSIIPRDQPLLSIDYSAVIDDMIEQNTCYSLDTDQRFPSTCRIYLSEYKSLKGLLGDLRKNLKEFLLSNGDKPDLIKIFDDPIHSRSEFKYEV